MAGTTNGENENPLRQGGTLIIDAAGLDALAQKGRESQGKPKTGQRGGGRPPVDSKTRARIRKLAREGMSRNGVARECGVSASTVSKVCAEARPPISFDRRATATATAAVVFDAKAKRARVSDSLIRDAGRLRKMLFAPMTRVHYSVTDGRVEYDGPTSPGEMKDLAIAMGILLDKHMALVKFDSDDRDLPAVDKWLDAMMAG